MLNQSISDEKRLDLNQHLKVVRNLRCGNKELEAARYLMNLLRDDLFNGAVYAELGLSLFRMGLMDRSTAAFEEAIRLEPENLSYHVNFSGVLHHTRKFEDSIRVGMRALALNPESGLAHMNLGLSYSSLMDWDLGIKHFQEAVKWVPNNSGAWLNLGLIYTHMCDDDAAIACFTTAVSLSPGESSAWICLATSNLRNGNFKEGWEQFAKRFDSDPSLRLLGETPIWKGEPLEGKTIHLLPEQGLGDLVQFIRFAQTLSEKGARVVATVPAKLRELLEQVPGLSQCAAAGEHVGRCDFQSTVMELPRWLGIDATNIPLSEGYLTAPQAGKDMCDKLRGLGNNLKVGIVWSGNPKHVNDHRRSMLFSDLALLLDIPNVSLINLQMGTRVEQMEQHPRGAEVANWMSDDMSALDTASLIRELDLVITVDTFVAHLSAAMAVPTWLLVASSPDWRWRTEGFTSAWYKSVRLFRQAEQGPWHHVVRSVAEAIQETYPHTRYD